MKTKLLDLINGSPQDAGLLADVLNVASIIDGQTNRVSQAEIEAAMKQLEGEGLVELLRGDDDKAVGWVLKEAGMLF